VLVNAGIYVLSPECLDYIPENKFYNMTTLFEDLVADRKKPVAFPIHEYWMDIGRPEEFTKAGSEMKKMKRKNN
jgi:NDP-sugar pyrophosphorylase family protein